MARIPDFLRNEVIQVVYERLDKVHWEQLQDDERSDRYAAFVEDPAIGGRLNPYKDESGIRVWIKDGPAKEYRRALEGIGSYAKYTSRQLTGPAELVEQALGRSWSVVANSIQQKPMRCDAVHVDGRRLKVLWGPGSSFKDLYWYASVTRADAAETEIAIVVTKLATARLPMADWNRYERLSRLISVSCYQVTQNVTKKPG
jgi:hypothetical protein